MISIQEYLGREPNSTVVDDNGKQLLGRVNELLNAFHANNPTYPLPMNSGLRSPARNMAVGGAADSRHLTGQAIDIGDKDRTLAVWCFNNYQLLKDIGLWCEDPRSTPTWVHFQSVPPKSGIRFYIPSAKFLYLANTPLSEKSIRANS